LKFYAVTLEGYIDCFYDFELHTFGDGICKNNLLPSRSLAESMAIQVDENEGVVIEVLLEVDGEDLLFNYEDIWTR
jgi:hypothetical protein